MLEGIVSDVLVRVLGSYVDGLNRESIRVGVWRGDLELKELRLRPDALAVLFESLGLDLPVTVTAGYIGRLRLEVPWKSLRSAPVRIFMNDLTVVASPVSDGDQTALDSRDKRLKKARLATDEALRDAKFSVRAVSSMSHASSADLSSRVSEVQSASSAAESQAARGNRVTRWGWRFTSQFVTKIVDNIQIDVENVIVQYEDASSVRDRPYTATVAVDSLQACSTNQSWSPVFLEDPSSPVVHKVVIMRGLVLNWEPGNSNNDIKSWILGGSQGRDPGHWAGFVRKACRHAIRPLDGELRVALTKSGALTAAISGKDPELAYLKNNPRVQLDLHLPDVNIRLDDFQYHTLLSTIMYLSDIDRKVRPKTAKGRWLWALDRLLPRFKERRDAALRFNSEGMRVWRERREMYCRARNTVVNARRQGVAEPTPEAEIVKEIEGKSAFRDVILFRDIADRALYHAMEAGSTSVPSSSRFWSLFTRARRDEADNENHFGTSNFSASSEATSDADDGGVLPRTACDSSSLNVSAPMAAKACMSDLTSSSMNKDKADDQNIEDSGSDDDNKVPNFRMGFLLERGSIQLGRGGHSSPSTPIANLLFRELCLGIETRPLAGFLLEALLGNFEVVDMQQNVTVMYPRASWAGAMRGTASQSSVNFPDASFNAAEVAMEQSPLPLHEEKPDQSNNDEDMRLASRLGSQSTTLEQTTLHSYPQHISEAIADIREECGQPEKFDVPPEPQSLRVFNSLSGLVLESSASSPSEDAISLPLGVNREDLPVPTQNPLKYIAALRLNQEEAPDGEWSKGATRIAMDLAIGGMEVLMHGPNGAFNFAVSFWHPREKMPSIMHFLSKAAAPRLASLRMDIQKAILERSVPMRMDIFIRAPRFVVSDCMDNRVSLIFDMGTFAMETSTSTPRTITPDPPEDDAQSLEQPQSLSIRYTDYRMIARDLGLYVASEQGTQHGECIIRPFSVHLVLQVLNNASFVEAMTLSSANVKLAKVALKGKMPSLQTSLSYDAFRYILDIAKGWGSSSQMNTESGIEPNQAMHSVSVSAELEQLKTSLENDDQKSMKIKSAHRSSLTSFEMILKFQDLQLELRDAQARPMVTISTTGTSVRLKRRNAAVDFEFSVRTFMVVDGSRGATAPFRRLAYAGLESNEDTADVRREKLGEDMHSFSEETNAFIVLAYNGDLELHEQALTVRILSLHLVCVRETYLALADFFYSNKRPHGGQYYEAEPSSRLLSADDNSDEKSFDTVPVNDTRDSKQLADVSDPFNAVGMTTSDAARVLREKAGRGMELSKQAIADRGKLSLTADLDGLSLTLVTAEGAIACFDVTDCHSNLTQYPSGAVAASGELGGFVIRDLTSAFDVYSETISYTRGSDFGQGGPNTSHDGWVLEIPTSREEDTRLEAHLCNVRIVYLHRFIIILKKYLDVMHESLKPVIEMKGGIGEAFYDGYDNDMSALEVEKGRIRLDIVTENVDVVMPRHSQSPYEALRFIVGRSSITNQDGAAPGYRLGVQIDAAEVKAHVLYEPPAEGEGRALTTGGRDPVLRYISPKGPLQELVPFSENISIVAKLDAWRRRKVPEVVLNADGVPVLKDGEEEREYDPGKWLPTIRVRISAPDGISARLCEAEYSILYFAFTENIIERPDIEFTDIVRGLKTPILPARKPVQPIMFSSNKMPPNYQILFEVPVIDSVIMSGGDPRDNAAKLIRSQLSDLVGCFEYGVDYRMTIEISANMRSLQDARPDSQGDGMTLIMPKRQRNESFYGHGDHTGLTETQAKEEDVTRSVTLTWDRPFGFRANVMVVVSDLRIVVDPELFRDLSLLTAPGFPFLKSSAPPPLLRFNGRLLILTISRPEVWLMARQFPGDLRSLVIRGDVIAKVQWAAVTGRNSVEVAGNGIRINLSNAGPFHQASLSPSAASMKMEQSSSFISADGGVSETPMLYPSDVSVRFEGSGYDPPERPSEQPVKTPGSTLQVNAESFLARLDVNDTPLILAVGSRLVRLRPNALSRRPVQPGRFDEWIDRGEHGDAKLSIHFVLPQGRLMFTDETAGRYVPIMEARVKNAVLRSNFPWLARVAFEFALDLFNEEKGWWEPGIESFPLEIATSRGRSGSRAIHIRADRNVDVNVTPNTISGASRVSRALKSAIEDLKARLQKEELALNSDASRPSAYQRIRPPNLSASSTARRPSVAAFCVRNETGRSVKLWLPYDSRRRSLGGNGGEIEIEHPSDDLLWTALGAVAGVKQHPSSSRRLSMSCNLSLSGYEALTLSTEHTGYRLAHFIPDSLDMASPANSGKSLLSPLTLVWAVTMRDGVPCGCLRSVLRLVNRTRTLLEVSVGGLRKCPDGAVNPGTGAESIGVNSDHTAHGTIRAGEAWSIPIYAIHRDIRIRPALFHAPDFENEVREDDSRPSRGRVYYSFRWSDPMSKVSSLHEAGRRVNIRKRPDRAQHGKNEVSGSRLPLLTCKGENSTEVFCLSLYPKTDHSYGSYRVCHSLEDQQGWVDVHLFAPLVIHNLMPRPVCFRLARPGRTRQIGNERLFAEGYIEPSRECHLHGIGRDLERVAIALGMDNSSATDEVEGKTRRRINVGSEFHSGLKGSRKLAIGTGKYRPFSINLHCEESITTTLVRMYSDFWVRNRSDTDLFFRDKEHNRDQQSMNPKIFLRGRPPGTKADKYISFSGQWLSFQAANTLENKWVALETEVPEIDKPLPISFDDRSLLIDVRPGRGAFAKTLLVTIRNSAWLENRTGAVIQWCQPLALNSHGVALSSKVHTVPPGQWVPIHWDFQSQKKSLCLRRANDDESSDWIWSRPVSVEGLEGEFAAKMYRPKREEQYIARILITKTIGGACTIVVHKEDRKTPPYRIVNQCLRRSIAFRQSRSRETLPWLVRPGRTTRYSWDDPQAPVKKRSLVVEIIENVHENSEQLQPSDSSSNGQLLPGGSVSSETLQLPRASMKTRRETKFELNIDVITDQVSFSHSRKFDPEILVSVHVDGPTKVVTFRDKRMISVNSHSEENDMNRSESQETGPGQLGFGIDLSNEAPWSSVDIALFVKAIGVSFVEAESVELAYLSVTGVHFRLDRFDGQQLIEFAVQDLQLDNQLVYCAWPVVLWSPPPTGAGSLTTPLQQSSANDRRAFARKPFLQVTINGPHPSMSQGIVSFRGIFMALQQLHISVDEDFVLRVWLFVGSLIEAAGGSSQDEGEQLNGNDGYENGIGVMCATRQHFRKDRPEEDNHVLLHRLYVENLELCPLKLTVSFTSSRTSTAAERVGGFRSLIRTLVAVLGNVENAEFRFNALELQHVFDTISHFCSLIAEYYISQGSNQKMVLLASNSLIGNPSALFDSIATGTRDFFVEPANAKGSADFVASIGRGSSSLLTNTVGGLVGSLGAIPRAVAQGLETAVGDREYLAERDSIRGGRARMVSTPAQGLFAGALSFGHGIASGAAGLIRDPLQGAAQDGPSGFFKGLGKGVIGGVLKPITGALDLIAEPAAGFRTMMVSDRNKAAAEPVRPPRSFRGVNRDQMVSYDLKSALGQAILDVVNRAESKFEDEILLSWSHLVAISSAASDEEVVWFLWALLRRSTRSSHFQFKHLLDAHGNPQRAEKMRVGLVTTRRVMISSLEGHVLWEHPLSDIIDTQVSMESKDYLMIGVRPVGHDASAVVAPSWKKIHCGSMSSRDELNGSIKKALQDLRAALDVAARCQHVQAKSFEESAVPLREIRRDRKRDGSVEMIDMSAITSMDGKEVNATELRSLHRDVSVGGKQDVITQMKIPGRHGKADDLADLQTSSSWTIAQQLDLLRAAPPQRQVGAVRSVRVLVANDTADHWNLWDATLQSGSWAQYPPKHVYPHSAFLFEADGTTNRIKDVAGFVAMVRAQGQERDLPVVVFAVKFLNPLLANNVYAMQAPSGYSVTRNGGEKGDHVVTTITIRKVPYSENTRDDSTRKSSARKAVAEPLLFGRSSVSAHLPPISCSPPHSSKTESADPNDPELVEKLCSLGFTKHEAKKALNDSHANLSKAYSTLLTKKGEM